MLKLKSASMKTGDSQERNGGPEVNECDGATQMLICCGNL